MLIDLHTHSTASDGTDRPAELVRAAHAAGLDVVALTDHDSTAGWDAAAAARPAGLALVRGAELSCTSQGISQHLLAYLFDPSDAPLRAEMARTYDDRLPRAQEMVRRLAAAGYPITWEAVRAEVRDGAPVGRPHLADALTRAGVVGGRDEAFASLLHSTGPFHVRHYATDPATAVRLVRSAGGVTVFAHPAAGRRGRTVGEEVIVALARAGLTGLEVDHRDHEPAERARLRGLARELGLVVTGGSDYHGSGKGNRLGENRTDPEAYAALLASATGVPVIA